MIVEIRPALFLTQNLEGVLNYGYCLAKATIMSPLRGFAALYSGQHFPGLPLAFLLASFPGFDPVNQHILNKFRL
jgi:hypothetical protein